MYGHCEGVIIMCPEDGKWINMAILWSGGQGRGEEEGSRRNKTEK